MFSVLMRPWTAMSTPESRCVVAEIVTGPPAKVPVIPCARTVVLGELDAPARLLDRRQIRVGNDGVAGELVGARHLGLIPGGRRQVQIQLERQPARPCTCQPSVK